MVDSSIISEALKLLVIGMVTVFFILMIVIYLGKLLVFLVNKYAPEEQVNVKSVAKTPAVTVDTTTKAIIDAAVSQITGGKGKVKSIKKI